MREQGELAYENLNMMLTVQKLTEENQRLREALRDNETFVKTWSDEYDAMKAEIERLRAVEEAHTEWCAARAALFTKSTPEGWTRLANAEHALYALKGEEA